MSALLIAGAAASAIWALHYYLLLSNDRKKAHDKLNDWMYQGIEKTSWSDSVADRIDGTEWAKKMRIKLDQASLDYKPSDYSAYLFLGLIVVTLVMNLMVGIQSIILCIIIASVVIYFASSIFLKSRKHIYAQRLDNQLSEACRLLSSAARAGLSIPQGLQLVVQEMSAPIKNELGQVVREVELGRDLEDSVRDLYKRVETKDVQVFINALIIQRRAGGDLAKVMSEMASTMEERKIIHQTIRALTAQARASAYALPAMSILIAFMLSKMVDNFWGIMSNLPGIIILTIFALMQVLGVFLVKKISQIRV
ncbi:type II secretion system F family protein [Marininema halotolerans]|uniref:Tight adherence protein B n=1 Tax=Marininema halotolerans TaxID=1155944 RepID=A0A1I6T9U1_9BACL|nr:type II secretion system F family protein [Marininema halotolerans]SFS85979.1 tight adherence protein B [Marininema halotolerans]